MRVLSSLIAVCIVLFLSGCWDNRDINHRVLPVVMGVTMKENEYLIYLQIPVPSGNTTKTKIVTGAGKTINHAVDKISANLEDHVDLLHVKVILVDTKYAQKGLDDIIADFMRGRDVSTKTLIAICDDDMDHFFTSATQSMEPKGTALYDFFEKNAGWNPQIALTRVWEVYRSIHSYTRDVAIPVIRSGKTTVVQHIGAAVVKNGKMVAQINPDETLLFNAFNGESTQGKIEVSNHASVLIISNAITNKSLMVNSMPILKSNLKLKVVILETKGNPTTETIKQELEDVVKQRFDQMFAKLQKSGADILGTGQYFRSELSRAELKNWRTKYYSELKLELQVDAIIENTGFLNMK
ncbi:Ger(x)C family spore germination protein [Paenibacillus sp. FJAT-27812]|uniref:Ger(x)C family spore germination protein n=1 Tax=Paenibacillus sp. FJAT-27812 TaxID=1684143 RepID=UPI0006A7AC59|nr:Ger(x)C family spore germination protein [Paenibacillus sp. FJAT-27812]